MKATCFLLFALLTCMFASSAALAGDTSWNRFFGGVDLGAGWSRASQSYSSLVPFPSPSLLYNMPVANSTGNAGSNATPAVTVRFGRTALAFERIVLGLEVEAGYARSTASYASTTNSNSSKFFGAALNIASSSQDIASARVSTDWMAAIRVRVGYLLTNKLLVFGTAGPALTHAMFSVVHNQIGTTTTTNSAPFASSVTTTPFNATLSSQTDNAVFGLSFSGGAEYRISERISLRGECTYARFTRMSLSIANVTTQKDLYTLTPTVASARFGLAYYF